MATTHVLFSGALTFGIPLALVIGQVVARRRRPRGGWPRDPRVPAPLPPKPLPDCLIPRPMTPRPAPRIRVLEDA